MTSIPPASLRERKKAETWTAIHEAAASLALDRGLERTTVEAVAERAGISPRTFFNYFPSKDDAVLGMRAPVLDPALLDDLDPGHELLEQVTRLLLAVARTAYAGGNRGRRRRLVQQYPQLGQRRREHAEEAEELVRRALADRLAADPPWAAGSAEEAGAEAAGAEAAGADELARMVVLLAGVPLRFALSSPAHAAEAGLTAEALEASLALFRRVRRVLP
ncbi:hypothetical protein AS188_10920 [Kocuria flava]|uniref:HTH tetR-type domain-containing protein n=1 Tax=Kocuria flava TaxID=446860 RepID=A0A0U3HXG5_9MICC|nr:TetR/AcrR family transcriptional regulator [Kocuria flava]ALU40175.1 hypothetical protein AS188_10920 [Kocuria flava]GEO93246.1 hypothetical protein KFL01_25520 [Kocuria flava]